MAMEPNGRVAKEMEEFWGRLEREGKVKRVCVEDLLLSHLVSVRGTDMQKRAIKPKKVSRKKKDMTTRLGKHVRYLEERKDHYAGPVHPAYFLAREVISNVRRQFFRSFHGITKQSRDDLVEGLETYNLCLERRMIKYYESRRILGPESFSGRCEFSGVREDFYTLFPELDNNEGRSIL